MSLDYGENYRNRQTKIIPINQAERRRPENKKEKEMIIISNYDTVVFVAVIILVLFGVAMVFSSSYYMCATRKLYDYDMFYFLKKQSIAAILGFGAMLFTAIVFKYDYYRPLSFWIYMAANVALIYVRLVEEPINGAYRWINLGFTSFQPSELAKVALILYLAAFLSQKPDNAKTLKGFLISSAIIAIPCSLVFWGKNMSTAIILCAIGYGMFFVASPYFWRFILAIGAAVSGLVSYLAFFAKDFRGKRFEVWQDPFSDPTGLGYQTIQSLYAVASGGLFGLGLGQSRQKLIFMPEPHNDFIFAIICEELGLFGAAIVLMLFAVLVWRAIRISMNSQDTYGSLIAAGASIMIAVQVIINVSVVTNTIPNTGIPLPFISYGGTSIVFIMMLMGILLNISKYTKSTIY